MKATCGTEPVRWWCFDNAVLPVQQTVPPASWSGWEAHYDNELEKGKRTTRRLHELLPAFAPALHGLRQDGIAWSERLGYPVYDDPYLHGGGLHVTAPGGWLQAHLDYALHPDGCSIRALNVIAFLHPVWESHWGGELVLTDATGLPVRAFTPLPGRVVAFEVSDASYHACLPTSADAAARVSVAAYYLAHISTTRPCDAVRFTRRKALFLPRR